MDIIELGKQSLTVTNGKMSKLNATAMEKIRDAVYDGLTLKGVAERVGVTEVML